MTDIRSKRAATAGSEVDPSVSSPESVAPLNDSAEEVATDVIPPAEELPVQAISISPEEPSVSPAPSSSPVDSSDIETQVPATENTELSQTDQNSEPPIEYAADSAEPAIRTETEIEQPKIDFANEKPSPPDPIISEIPPPIQQSVEESSPPVTPSSHKAPMDQPHHELQHPQSNRGKGTIETIEELCQRSLEGISSLIYRSDERDAEQIRQFKADLAFAKKEIYGLNSERDKLVTDYNNLVDACEKLQDQLKSSAPYHRIFSPTLPAWMSFDKLSSLLNLPSEDGRELGIDPKIVWRIMPAYINLVEEIKSDTLAPRQLASASDAFSEAVCAIFDGNDQQVTNWHENANEYLKPAGYSFMILAVGAQIDNDLVTGSIQGKTTIGTIKRMPLIKDGGDVIRKADVTGV